VHGAQRWTVAGAMLGGVSETRLTVFLTEDDRAGRQSAADAIVALARRGGVAATVHRGIEGFGASGHLRAARLPDLARGLPLVVEIVGAAGRIAEIIGLARELAPGVLVTTEELRSGPPPPG